ncbi:MAG: bifunctional response regulator/alkaline phosphatase family protein [Flavobacteriales bacterium]|nr:bifunctional response regulator/alkaline phosphatase family protein [Flavobacteriales bacterium]MBL6873162.1 bifunctional response regulator/alkaline phosphatase family protein [Flavobacteriales bacterium]
MNFNDKITILWADDEIDLLRPHIMFLEEKGYSIQTANNGVSAIELLDGNHFDLVFLDENMPGLSGLETLLELKNKRPNLPVIMITKSEEESIMEEAIGSKISDYLIKPVNPNQILLSIKKHIDSDRLVSKKTNADYQKEFRDIGIKLGGNLSIEEWEELFKKITFWELELEKSGDDSMKQILEMQKSEANAMFFKFIKSNYESWFSSSENSPLMSHQIFKHSVLPELNEDKTTFFIVIDNLRYDQWKMIQPSLMNDFRIQDESLYFSILPTATQYSRNAIFSGLLPLEMEQQHKDWWKNDTDEGGKNLFEKEFLEAQMRRLGKAHLKVSYNKITNIDAGRRLVDNMQNLMNNHLNVIVYNFVDMLSHARTDMKVIKELAEGNAAYRSLTTSWFEYSPLKDMFAFIANNNSKVVVTTDHGTVLVKKPTKVLGEKDLTTNLRYKLGRNMKYDSKEVFEINQPKNVFLPIVNMSSKYIFAREDYFFAYPNNYNHYVNHYKETFQHGGISLEEMIIPIITLSSK